MHAADIRRIVERDSAPQTLVERLFEQRRLVELREHLGDGRLRNVARDAERFDLPHHSGAATLPESCLGPRRREGGAAIVDRALGSQTAHGPIDVFRIELPTQESRPQLRFRQLTPRQHFQAG